MNKAQENQQATDSPSQEEVQQSFDLNSFNEDIVDPTMGEGPEPEVEEGEGAESEESAKSGEEETEPTQEAEEGEENPSDSGDEGNVDKRLSDAQAKIHEQAEQIKTVLGQLEQVRSQTTSKQQEVFDAILQNIRQQGQKTVPTEEELEKKFNEVAEKSPMQAVKLLVEELQASSGEGINQKLDALKNEIVSQFKGTSQDTVINANLNSMKSKEGFEESFDEFSKYLWQTYSVIPDRAQQEQAVKGVCANPETLERAWNNFVLLTKGPQAVQQKKDA